MSNRVVFVPQHVGQQYVIKDDDITYVPRQPIAHIEKEKGAYPYMNILARMWCDKPYPKAVHNVTYTLVAKYGFDVNFAARNNQKPYFSITGHLFAESYSGGQLHDDIREHLPQLAYLLKWHLTDCDGTPIHYVANGLFWLRVAMGLIKYDHHRDPYFPMRAFNNTIKMGCVPSDEEQWKHIVRLINDGPKSISAIINEDVRRWLENRQPTLTKVFHNDMIKAGLIRLESIEEKNHVE